MCLYTHAHPAINSLKSNTNDHAHVQWNGGEGKGQLNGCNAGHAFLFSRIYSTLRIFRHFHSTLLRSPTDWANWARVTAKSLRQCVFSIRFYFWLKCLATFSIRCSNIFENAVEKKKNFKMSRYVKNGNGLPRGNLKHFSTQCEIFNYPNCPQKIEKFRLHSISRYTKNI